MKVFTCKEDHEHIFFLYLEGNMRIIMHRQPRDLKFALQIPSTCMVTHLYSVVRLFNFKSYSITYTDVTG